MDRREWISRSVTPTSKRMLPHFPSSWIGYSSSKSFIRYDLYKRYIQSHFNGVNGGDYKECDEGAVTGSWRMTRTRLGGQTTLFTITGIDLDLRLTRWFGGGRGVLGQFVLRLRFEVGVGDALNLLHVCIGSASRSGGCEV
jgi:hypothetical protein